MCFCGKNGTTPVWLTENTPTTPLIWTPPCWIPSGNRICSLQMKKEPISTRSPQTTSCCGFSKMAAFCTASGRYGGEGAGHEPWDHKQPSDVETLRSMIHDEWEMSSRHALWFVVFSRQVRFLLCFFLFVLYVTSPPLGFNDMHV